MRGTSSCPEDSQGWRLVGTASDSGSRTEGSKGCINSCIICRTDVYPEAVITMEASAILKGLTTRALWLLLLSKCWFKCYILRDSFSKHLGSYSTPSTHTLFHRLVYVLCSTYKVKFYFFVFQFSAYYLASVQIWEGAVRNGEVKVWMGKASLRDSSLESKKSLLNVIFMGTGAIFFLFTIVASTQNRTWNMVLA